MSCPGCDNSSTTYTRCNPPVSTNCVFYQGETLTCQYDTSFQICKGHNLNDVQETIFRKICDITNEINVSSLNFTCSKNWGTKTDPQKTLKLLLSEVTTATCDNATSIDAIMLLFTGIYCDSRCVLASYSINFVFTDSYRSSLERILHLRPHRHRHPHHHHNHTFW